MVGDTTIAGLFPHIVLTMGVEPRAQGSLIGCSLIPYLTRADLIKQQPVVIFLEQVLHLGIGSSQRVGTLLEDFLLRHFTVRGLHHLTKFGIDNLVTDLTTLKGQQQFCLQRIEGFELFALLHQDDMIAYRGEDGSTHLSWLQGISGILKLFQCLSWTEPGKQTSVFLRHRVIGNSRSQLSKVSTSLQGTVNRIDTCFHPILFLCGGLRRHF